MKQLKKRLLAAILSFVMVFLSMADVFPAYAGPPALVDDPDILAEVTYDRNAVNARGNSDFYVGEEVPFYANITISSTTRSIPGAYGKLYLPKNVFPYVSASNISTWINRPASNYLSIDSSSNSEFHIVTLKFNSLGGGTTQTVPFKGTLRDRSLANNETYVIPYQVYDANNTLLESSNNTFTAKTYPVGYTDENNNVRIDRYYAQGTSSLQNNTTLANDLATTVQYNTRRTNWPASGTYHGTETKIVGGDRRKTRVTVQLPANENFDTTDSLNTSWTYNAANHTISKDIEYQSNLNYTYDSFNIRYNNQTVGTQASPVTVEFPITWQYVNDDGSLDTSSLEKSKSSVRYWSFPRIPAADRGLTASKTASPWRFTFTDRDKTEHVYNMGFSWYWYAGNPEEYPTIGTYHTRVSSLVDTPTTDMELVGYQIRSLNPTGKVQDTSGNIQNIPALDNTQLAALSNNKLVGVKDDGSEEVIATNVQITSNADEVRLPTPKFYKKIELRFTNPIEIQAPTGRIIDARYRFRFEENAYNTAKAQLASKPNNASSNVQTRNVVTVNGDNGAGRTWTGSGSDYVTWTKAFAAEYEHDTQNQNLGTKYLNEEFSMTDNIRFHYFLPPGGRKIKNPKFFLLIDPGLEFKGIQTSIGQNPELTPAVMSNYRVEYNFKNTGKTAYIWDLPDLNIPEGNDSYKYVYFSPKFKTTRNMAGGQNSIDTYLSWDNNEEAASNEVLGKYDDVLDLDNDGNTTEKFSSKKATYLYSPPLELILTKRSKRADSNVAQYSSLTTPDSEQIVDYKLNIFNNSINGVSGFTFFDILPHVGDKSIAPDQQGNYADRGSTYRLELTGPLDPNPNYTYEYSTTPVTEGNIAANYAGATWSSSVSDWSAVTMFRMKMKSGYTLASGAADDITFRAKMPDTVPLDTTDKAVNTFAGFSGDSYTGAFEALSNVVIPKKYKISGKIYYDVPPAGGSGNGKFLTTDDDVPAAGRTVSLFDASGNPVLDASGNPVVTTADSNGNFAFDNISKAGTYKVVVTPGFGDTLSPISVTSTSLVIGNDFTNNTSGASPVFESSVTLTPSDDKKTTNAALEASNSTLKVKYVDMAGNPIPLDDGSGNVADTDSVHGFRDPYTVTPPTTLTGVANYEYAEPDLTNGRPLSGTLNPGQNVVILKYKRKTAGNITVNHFEVGGSTQLYTPSGATSPSAETYVGTEKLGLSENLTNREADIANFEYVSTDVTGAPSATSPSATGDTTVTYQTAPQTVTYRYKRKDAADITVHHYEVGGSTELYTPTGSTTPSAQTIPGAGKLGTTVNLTNKEADIANFEYVSTDVTGADSATTPTATGDTTLTHKNTPQTVIYRYRRKNAGDVIVHHYEQGTNTPLVTDIPLNGTNKLGLPYNTNSLSIPNYTLVAMPSNQNGTFAAGTQHVYYYYKRNNAGNIVVNHYEVGGSTQLYKPTGSATVAAENYDGTAKLGLTENITNKAADIDNYEYVSVDVTGANGATSPSTTGATTVTYQTGTQTITYRYRRKNAGNITVNHYEVGTTTQLYKPTGSTTPAAENFNGTGKLGLTENLTNKAADIDNYEFVNVNVSGASGASTPNANGDTTVTYNAGNQVVNYYYRRKNAANITVHHYIDGTTTELYTPAGSTTPSAVVIDGSGKLGTTENLTNKAADIDNYEYVGIDVSGANTATTPTATGDTTLTHSTTPQTVIYKYRRKNAGNITVNHYEVGTTTQLYKPTGSTTPAAENFDGTGKLGLTENLTNKAADIDNYEFVNVNVSGASGASTPSANGDTTVTYKAGNQVVNYYYRRKNAANITVHHYIDGTTTELYTPAGSTTPSAVVIDGSGKLGTTENLTNKAADIANYEYVGIDVSGANTATTPSATGDTTLTHSTTAQTVIYKYRRKDAGNVIVKYIEDGTNIPLKSPDTMNGTGKLGLPYTTTPENFTNYELVSATPANHTGNYPPAGSDITVTYVYRRKTAGNITVNHYEVGTTTQLYKPTGSATPAAENFNGTGKMGLSESLTNKAADIDNYEYVSVDVTGASGANTPNANGDTTVTYNAGNQVVNYYYRRKNASSITVHHIEDGTNTELYTPTGASGPSPEIISGNGRLGTNENLTNRVADIPNFEYVSVDVTGANTATTPSATGATTLTHTTSPQTVIYKYRRKNVGDVLVHHYEAGTTTSLANDENLSGVGKSGLTYTTNPASIPNYTVVNATPTGHTGTYPATGTTVVTYEYRRNDAGNVTVHHYIDGTTTPLVPDTVLNGTGKLGLPYTTTDHNIPNYTLVAQPTNANGTFTTGNQTVTYYYRRNDAGNVVVHHLEAGTTTSLVPNETLNGAGKSGMTYTTSPASITNYTVVNATPIDHTGTYPNSGQRDVYYYYTRDNAADVTVKYVEQGTGTPLSSDDVLGGTNKLGLPYTTTEKNITDYELVAQPSNKNGTFLSTPQTVIYEYRRKPAGDVTSVYVDEGGNQIDIPETQSGVGKLGLPYTTTRKTIPNYTLVSVPGNENGTFVPGPQTVTYVYRRNDAGDVTVYHKSVYDNSDLSTPTVLDGTRKLGLPYATTPETYSDFEIATVPSNATGTFVSGSQSVTYLYKRKQSGGVTVNYLDSHGNRIETPDNITGTDNVGLPYTTTPKNIPGYTLITVPSNANGTFTVSPIAVNYIYKRQDAGNVVIEHVDEDGNVPLDTPEVLDGSERMGESYTSSSKSFDNYDLVSVPSNANGTFTSGTQTVTYVYRRRDAGNVIAHYVNTAGLPIESDEVLDGTRKLGLPYATGAKTIPGYSLYLVQGSETGVFTNGTTEVTYIYRKDPSVVITPVPPVTPTPIAPSPINPINPIDPINPVTPINPLTPSPITPGRIATPSQIITPGREQDLVIRPNRPMATPSIATGSNGRKGGSGSSDGNSSVRPTKTVTVQDTNSKDAIQKPEIVIDEPKISNRNPQPDKNELKKDIKSSISATRRAMSVPKTSDRKDVRGYMFIFISSLAAAVIFWKKKETK